jgi:multimeric flavodoxin WrbA
MEKSPATMNIEYYHASKYGNGAAVAEEFKKKMAARGVTVNVHHIQDSRPKEITPADLYIFSSPGRFGKPTRSTRRFLKKASLSPGTRYAVLVTELDPGADKKSGTESDGQKPGKCQQVIPTLNQILQEKGLVSVAQGKILVTNIKGPLEAGWQKKVAAFALQIPLEF